MDAQVQYAQATQAAHDAWNVYEECQTHNAYRAYLAAQEAQIDAWYNLGVTK